MPTAPEPDIMTEVPGVEAGGRRYVAAAAWSGLGARVVHPPPVYTRYAAAAAAVQAAPAADGSGGGEGERVMTSLSVSSCADDIAKSGSFV